MAPASFGISGGTGRFGDNVFALLRMTGSCHELPNYRGALAHPRYRHEVIVLPVEIARVGGARFGRTMLIEPRTMHSIDGTARLEREQRRFDGISRRPAILGGKQATKWIPNAQCFVGRSLDQKPERITRKIIDDRTTTVSPVATRPAPLLTIEAVLA